MLKIRAEQMHIFAHDVEFRKSIEHVRRFFPDECSTMSAEALAAFVGRSLKKARGYGFVAEDLLCYTDLSLLFGEGFDRKLSWARRILTDDRPEQLPFRGSRLYDRALIELKRQEPPPAVVFEADEAEA